LDYREKSFKFSRAWETLYNVLIPKEMLWFMLI